MLAATDFWKSGDFPGQYDPYQLMLNVTVELLLVHTSSRGNYPWVATVADQREDCPRGAFDDPQILHPGFECFGAVVGVGI